MAVSTPIANESQSSGRDIGFALGIVFILSVLFLPIPAFMIDLGLALSIAISVLILMVALWIQKPLDFSSFPTVLLIATMLRLSLNVATTRLILSNGAEGETSAGYVISGFSRLVMSGDFVIGLIVFLILVTVNFIVITKGATRIAEVGARFTLDAIPGKQMAIDADLSAGLLDEKEAQRRRRELEQESSFFGAMDGASKFVRGDAIAGLLITAVNIFGGIIIAIWRHDMDIGEAADIFTKLSVGDGLVSQIPALIISLAAGLLVSKGGNTGSADVAVLSQLGNYPRALFVASGLMAVLSLTPGLPFFPFVALSVIMAATGIIIPRRVNERRVAEEERVRKEEEDRARETSNSVKEALKIPEIELSFGKQLAMKLMGSHGEMGNRVAKMRNKFAREFGFVVPEIKVSENVSLAPSSYEIHIFGTRIAAETVSLGDVLVLPSGDPPPPVPYEEVTEPAFGSVAWQISEMFIPELRRAGYKPVDTLSVILTHLSEVIKNNLSQLFSYKDIRQLIGGLEGEYVRLVEEICPTHLSYSGLQAVMKLLLAERVSIRNMNLVLEAVAEIAPHVKRTEQIAEHVRMRLASQICGDICPDNVLPILRLGRRWELAFHNALKRNNRGDIVEFQMDPTELEQFSREIGDKTRELLDKGEHFAITTSPEARPYVRMVIERLQPTLPVLAHVEIARGVTVKALGSVS